MRLDLVQRAPSQHELGLLGKQINLVLKAYDAPGETYRCAVQDKNYLGSELFVDTTESRRFLMYDNLPGTINVMAIGIDTQTIFVELSPYDLDDVRRIAKEADVLPKGIRVDTRGIWFKSRKLASVTCDMERLDAEHGARVLWMIPRSKSEEDIRMVITVLDALDVTNAYLLESETGETAGSNTNAAPIGTMKLEQRMSLQMDLIQRQVPILALQQKLGVRAEQQQILEVQQVLRFESWLRRDPETAIVTALSNDPTPRGQMRVVFFVRFALARDVKKAAEANGRDISWKAARKIARNVMDSQPPSQRDCPSTRLITPGSNP
jgi:hypothetical protein